MIKACKPNIEQLRSKFSYDPESGEIKRKENIGRWRAGTIVGTTAHGLYRATRLPSGKVYIHILAWALHYGDWPGSIVDHVDGNPSNNRIGNLRLATKSQNGCNRGATRLSSSGVKGVFRGRNGRHRAEICINKKRIYLGEFRTLEEARQAYASKAIELHGDFSRLA